MIQCKCCMHLNQNDSAMCEACRLPLIASGGVDMDVVGTQYRRQLLDGCSIALKVYYYEPDASGNLVEQRSEYVTVANAMELGFREVKWFADEFNPPEIKREIELTVRVQRPDGYTDKTLRAGLKKSTRCSCVGLFLDEGLKVSFAVGSKEDYILSDAVSLLAR